MDRLIAATSWNEPQSLEQAVMVAHHQKKEMDWAELGAWVVKEKIANKKEVVAFYTELQRSNSVK